MVDETPLFGDDFLIDRGVTSGSDPTGWDPIGVDRRPDNPGGPGTGKGPGGN